MAFENRRQVGTFPKLLGTLLLALWVAIVLILELLIFEISFGWLVAFTFGAVSLDLGRCQDFAGFLDLALNTL